MARPVCNVVWFKRDLRGRDHAPLRAAAEAGLPVVLLFTFEPSYLACPESDPRHWRFVWQSLADLRQTLAPFGLPLLACHAEAPAVFDQLLAEVEVKTVFSYQETNLALTFARDRAVAHLLRQRGVAWREFQQNGVLRGLRHRQGWPQAWAHYMAAPPDHVDLARLRPLALPPELTARLAGPPLPAVYTTALPGFQPGGERYAWRYWHSFSQERAAHYSRHLSKPEASRRSCSRLSPYLAFGNLSVRQVVQAARQIADAQPQLARPLANFEARLLWHCHYIQKFEMDCRMEHRPINRAHAKVEKEWKEDWFQAWATGLTGYPLVDACMRCVVATGYLNFRMRAMLVSFLSHVLWQPWQPGAVHLARQFLDFEPGIHYPQFQMQTYAVGAHFLRIYDPVKQSHDHDPAGHFIKQWVPELAQVPASLIHEPWRLSALEQSFYHCRLGIDYPRPLTDYVQAAARARQIQKQLDQDPEVQAENLRIVRRLSNPLPAPEVAE
ncbi:MAG: DNA photolyase family protein [Bernardetiaceae bacterium]|jgi:deoxyribodipyrimidine photo-lyase|nr:DNA photolyase family protein [Bernardetiaceae bacterium]